MKIYFLLCLFSPFIWLNAQEKWTLEQCIDYAHENNLSVVNSRISEEISRTSENIFESQQLPSVNGRFGNSVNFGFQRTLIGTFEYNQSYVNNLGLDANIAIYNAGKLKLQNQKAGINNTIQELNTDILTQDISLQIASLYLQIILNRELMLIAQEQLANSNEQLDKTEKLYAAGAIPYSTMVEQVAQNANDAYQVENSVVNLDRSRFNLAIFLQLDEYEEFDVEHVIIPEEVPFDALDVHDVIDYAIANRPEVAQAKAQVESAEKDIEIAETAKYPTVSGGYSFGTNYYDFFNAQDEKLFQQWLDNHNQQLFVSLNIPIFNKANRYNIQQAQQQKVLTEQNIRQQELQLTQDIQSAYFDADASYRNYQNLKIAYEAANTAESYGKKSYDAGKISIYDYNIQRTNTIVAKSRMINAKYDYFFKLKILDFYAGKPIEIEYANPQFED